jgi:hypothetical protein
LFRCFASATTLPFGGVVVMVKMISRDFLSRRSNDNRLAKATHRY